MKAFDRISGKGFQNLPVFFFRIFLENDENFQRDMVDQNTDDWVGKIFFFSQMFFILISISSFVFGTVTNNKKKIKLKKFKKSKPRYLSILRLLSNSSAIQRPEKFTGSQPRLAAISILCDWNYLHSLFRGSHNMTEMIKIKKNYIFENYPDQVCHRAISQILGFFIDEVKAPEWYWKSQKIKNLT